ncbi:hypothetical protein FOXG_20207 [Fusarium oxysporum f. sp. lycopersici 4287]|uniref:Uncharacterized protein n=2 Tax=Fusarium oxysporum TaxID=5507 RepID=A0A0J9VEH9_FUSO4|nr:hypothetical protein FOXG_20207 [Fusarium oxysporum f. sp. lycopersici 4287]EXK28246.1 hypothetical protein FOMG_15247 [Fusarium oxysporum f. sp. melonis 26406]KNB09448.1 hypothetical protein FOXG_20207 [Fusarium oxysporum f. sp. lycopersici 4287]
MNGQPDQVKPSQAKPREPPCLLFGLCLQDSCECQGKQASALECHNGAERDNTEIW